MKPADNFDLRKFITEGKLLKENELNPSTKNKFDNLLSKAEQAVKDGDKDTLQKIYDKALTTGSKGWSYFIDALYDKGLAHEKNGILKWNLKESNLKETEDTNILSFLKDNKKEFLDALTKELDDDVEEYNEIELGIGADEDGNEDNEIAGLGEMGLDFSFNPKKVKNTYGDAYNFKLIIAGKPVYGISYNM